MTALILGMLARVVDNAAAVSEGLAAVSGQVAEAEAEFWEIDATQAGRYGHAGLRVSIDTEIKGSPASIMGVATWVSDELAPGGGQWCGRDGRLGPGRRR